AYSSRPHVRPVRRRLGTGHCSRRLACPNLTLNFACMSNVKTRGWRVLKFHAMADSALHPQTCRPHVQLWTSAATCRNEPWPRRWPWPKLTTPAAKLFLVGATWKHSCAVGPGGAKHARAPALILSESSHWPIDRCARAHQTSGARRADLSTDEPTGGANHVHKATRPPQAHDAPHGSSDGRDASRLLSDPSVLRDCCAARAGSPGHARSLIARWRGDRLGSRPWTRDRRRVRSTSCDRRESAMPSSRGARAHKRETQRVFPTGPLVLCCRHGCVEAPVFDLSEIYSSLQHARPFHHVKGLLVLVSGTLPVALWRLLGLFLSAKATVCVRTLRGVHRARISLATGCGPSFSQNTEQGSHGRPSRIPTIRLRDYPSALLEDCPLRLAAHAALRRNLQQITLCDVTGRRVHCARAPGF
ncbi:hypothetical protein P154DRAFT_605831, partial [Amniculicola lignicola CBS 123094]